MEDAPSFSSMMGNNLMKRFAQQQATWTKGPSFPSHMPDATARHCNEVRTRLGVSLSNGISYQSKRFRHQSPNTQKFPNDEASKHSFDLGYTAVLCMYRKLLD